MNIEIKVVTNDKKKTDLKSNTIFSVSFSTIGEEIWRDNFGSPVNPLEAISPDKIADSYKELYHNEWSAAYKALQKTGMIVMEEEIVKKLSTILHVSFRFIFFVLCCHNKGCGQVSPQNNSRSFPLYNKPILAYIYKRIYVYNKRNNDLNESLLIKF